MVTMMIQIAKNGDHNPWGPFRGGKHSLFEAGTHVPFFTYWKGEIRCFPCHGKSIGPVVLFGPLVAVVRTDDSSL